MNSVSLTGQDTIIFAGRLLTDFADADVVKLDYPNDTAVLKTGKNGNTIYAFNNTGLQCTLELRILLGSDDDTFINQLLALWNQNPPTFILITGQFIKNVGDGNGNITQVIYNLNGGVFKKNVPATENADGDTNQAVAMYSLIFNNAPRSTT